MPIDLSWYIPSRVVRAHVYNEAGAEQLKQMMADIQPFFENGSEPIHVLLDDATGHPPPISLKELKGILDVGKHPVEKLGWVVGIGNVNAVAKVVIPMLLKVVKIKYVRVNSVDEAIAFLKRQDMSLQTKQIEKSI